MQFLSHELIYFIRAIVFGVVVYFTCFYIFLYCKPIVEDILKVKKLDVDLWYMLSITISIVLGILGAIMLM
jgi:hypothetical protein